MPQLVTVEQLCISPFNVRLNAEDAEATGALEASIAVRGLLFPLVVHDMAPYRDRALPDEPAAAWGVLAGGRRLRAIRRLIEAGTLRRDFGIEVVTRDLTPAEITELSLAENLLRRQLRPYEVHLAVANAAEQGASIEEISEHLGQRPVWVRQQLRLGRLVPAIFQAYVDGAISDEQAQAFAATEDEELQRAAWAHFGSLPHDRYPHRIRAWYKIGDQALDRLLRFVGEEDYRAAGGRYELDLFADGPDRGRVVDDGRLRELAEAKLASIRTDLRRRTGHANLRFASEPPQQHGHVDHTLEFFPEKSNRKIALPGDQVVVTIEISSAGEAQARYWWTSRKAKREATREGSAPAAPVVAMRGSEVEGADAFEKYSEASQAARAAVKDEHGLTADGIQAMRSMRRQVLRAVLIADALNGGAIGRDYALWTQLRQELAKLPRTADAGARTLMSEWQGPEDPEATDVVQPHLEEMRATQLWSAAVEELKAQPFMTIADPADAFAAFHFAGDRMKSAAGAVLAGLALFRSCNVPGWRIAVHDRVAEILGVDDGTIRELWQPTPKFMALFPKMKRLELAQPHVDPEHFRDWHKQSDAVLSGATAGAVEQSPNWVHPLLSFGVASEHSTEQREAAE